jgi:hypothetical protein
MKRDGHSVAESLFWEGEQHSSNEGNAISQLSPISLTASSPISLREENVASIAPILSPTASLHEENASMSVDKSTSDRPKLRGSIENSGRFLVTDYLISALLKPAQMSDSDVPNGIKENVYFLLANTENMECRKMGSFYNDCDVYSQKGSTMKTHYFVKNENRTYMYVDKENGLYMTTVKRERVALEPQPSEHSILILKRNYAKLKRCPTYKRCLMGRKDSFLRNCGSHFVHRIHWLISG